MLRLRYVRPTYKPALLALLLAAVWVTFQPLVWSVQHAGQHDMRKMPESKNHGNTDRSPSTEASSQAKHLSDKRESEFNHHLAGCLVVLAGIFVLSPGQVSRVSSCIRPFWPICFLLASLFLLLFSDTEIWPLGSQTPWYAITHDVEDLQHKIFALILLALGIVEYQRIRGRWDTWLTPWVFPIAGLAGAVLLLFHSHSGDMHHAGGMMLMQHVQAQHQWYATIGFGIVTAKRMSELSTKWQKLCTIVWPVLLIVLGLSLTLYTE